MDINSGLHQFYRPFGLDFQCLLFRNRRGFNSQFIFLEAYGFSWLEYLFGEPIEAKRGKIVSWTKVVSGNDSGNGRRVKMAD